MTTKRIPVQIGNEAYQMVRRYSEMTGVPIQVAVTKAVLDWFTNVGEAHIEALSRGLSIPPRAKEIGEGDSESIRT